MTLSKHCNDEHTPFCDYVVGFDDVLTRLNLLPDNLSKGWLQSKIQTSDNVCLILKDSKD